MRPSEQKTLKNTLEAIRVALVSLRSLLQEQFDFIHQREEGQREENERQRRVQIEIASAISDLRPTEDDKREHRSEHNRALTVQVLLMIGTIGAFVAAAIYAGLAYDTYGEIKKQTKAATTQTSLLSQQLEETNSASLYLNPGIGDDGGVQIDLRNFGRYKATDIKVTTDFSVVELPSLNTLARFPPSTKKIDTIAAPQTGSDPMQNPVNDKSVNFSQPASLTQMQIRLHMEGKLGFKVMTSVQYYNGFRSVGDGNCLVRISIPPVGKFTPPGQGERVYGGYPGAITCDGFDTYWRQMLRQQQDAREGMQKDKERFH